MEKQNSLPNELSIIVTYRCNMRCKMCNIWKYPSEIETEITAKELEILPEMKLIGITGGEPFVRHDLEEIVEVSFRKAPRVIISTAGYHVDEIISLAEKFPKIGIRVSIEGLSTINDHLRGRDGGFDRGLRTLQGLKDLGIKDIGFGMTVSHKNSFDIFQLYSLANNMNMEFATATFHNSFYFHKDDNAVKEQDQVIGDFYDLIDALLRTKNPKNWFRAFFNLGLINYIKGNKRFLPCEAGTENFFIEPDGEVYPCNGLEEKYWKESMGNIRDVNTFEDLWFSDQAHRVRELVRDCPKNCWMIGTAGPVMKKYIRHPLQWVLKNKLKSMIGFKVDRSCLPDQYDVGQSKIQGDLRISNPITIEDTEVYPLTDNTRLMTHIIEIEHITDSMFIMTLERCGFQFIPGQSVSLGPHLRYYKNRDYTICSGIHDDVLRFLIRVVKKGEFSQYFNGLKPGDKVDVVGPYGEFWIEEPEDIEREYLFIAMGVGLGPFLSFVKSYPSLNYKILHGIRTKKDLPAARDLSPERYISCISQEEGGGFHGRVTEYLRKNEVSKTTYCYICGNPYMLRQTYSILKDKGIPDDLIFAEPYYAY